MKLVKLTRYLLLFSMGVLSFVGYTKFIKFIQIDNCLDKGGRWNYTSDQCEHKNSKYELNTKVAYELKIANNKLINFIRNYISEVANSSIQPIILILSVEQINDGKKYTLSLASHEIYAHMGNYSNEDKIIKDLEPQNLYAIIDDQIILIQSGIENTKHKLGKVRILD